MVIPLILDYINSIFSFLLSFVELYHYDDLRRYKLNIIVSDGSNTINFIVFEKTAQKLIRIPAQNLAISVGSDQFALPPAIKIIIGQEHVFQIVPDTLKFRSDVPSFKVIKFFPLNSNTKGKSPTSPTLFIKCEEHQHSPPTDRQAHKKIFVETPPNTEFSLGYLHNHSDN